MSPTVDALLLSVLGAMLVLAPDVSAPSQVEALQKAALLVQQGRLDEADRQVQPALSDPETAAAACSVLGTIRFQQKRFDESAALLQKAIRLEPGLLGAHLTLAHLYTLQGKSELALGLFRRALELDPSNVDARLALARSEMEKGNYRQSLLLAQPVRAALEQLPEGLFVLATGLLKTGNRSAAGELARHWTSLANVPQDWSIRFALLLAREGGAAESIAVLEHARRTAASSYELAFNLGGAYVLNGDAARALDAYDLALTLKPDSTAALQQAAGLAERQGELERSLSYWMRARKLAPDDPEILLGFGRTCLRMDLLDDAEPAVTRAAAMRPGATAFQYTLAAVKVGKRQFEEAQALLEQLVKQQPRDPQLQYALGSVMYTRGQLAEAAEHLRESVRLEPEQLWSRHYLALVARDQGRDADAIQMLERLVQRYPDHGPSRETLGGLLVTAQRYIEAEDNLRMAVRLNPRSVKANYQLGLLLARMGRKDEADKQLELTKSLRQEDEATSRLQLRLLDPDR